MKQPATILITGATGFLGSNLTRKLINNYHVIILKRSFSNLQRIGNILEKLKVYNINKISLKQVFEENRIDIIIHTATNYGRNKCSLNDIVEANLMFPVKLLELATSFNTGTFFNTDTILYKFLNNYVLSKKQFLEWLKQYSNYIQVINLKLEHMFGPNDDDTKFVTKMITKMLKNDENIELTKGEQKRDFIYIDDVVNAYEKTLNNLDVMDKRYSEFEIGTGESISIKELVEIIHRLCKSKSILKYGSIPYRENEIMESIANITDLKKLGWKPKTDVQKGLQYTINFEKIKLGV